MNIFGKVNEDWKKYSLPGMFFVYYWEGLWLVRSTTQQWKNTTQFRYLEDRREDFITSQPLYNNTLEPAYKILRKTTSQIGFKTSTRCSELLPEGKRSSIFMDTNGIGLAFQKNFANRHPCEFDSAVYTFPSGHEITGRWGRFRLNRYKKRAFSCAEAAMAVVLCFFNWMSKNTQTKQQDLA